MFKGLKNEKAQVISSEYVVLLFILAAVVLSMNIYFRRAVQARMYDARAFMVQTATDALGEGVQREYVPYYLNRESNIVISSTEDASLYGSPGHTSGFFEKQIDQGIIMTVNSSVAPPGEGASGE